MDGIEDMLADGSMVKAGVDENGEHLYVITDKCRELHPDVWKKQYQAFQADIYELWRQGFIDISMAQDSGDDDIYLNVEKLQDASTLEPRLLRVLEAIVEDATFEESD